MGCLAMQLAAPHVFGPPADREGAVALLREVVELGITHIDTSDYYGPHVTNQIIREALRPYPADLRTVTEDGARRGDQSGRPQALALEELRQAAHENLTNLRLETLDVVKLRAGRLDSPTSGSVAESLRCWRRFNSRGFRAPRAEHRHRWAVSPRSRATPSPGWPTRLHATPMAIALAWLPQRSPNILLIAGTSSAEDLRENVAGAALHLPADAVAELDAIAY